MMQATRLIGASALTTMNLSSRDCLVSCGAYKQCVRWKRKPLWLPTAKTKVFRVPKRPELPEEEKREILRLYNNYRTHMTSIIKYFTLVAIDGRSKSDPVTLKKLADHDFVRCHELNEKWNQQVAEERTVRLDTERKHRSKQIIQELKMKTGQDKNRHKQADEQIRQMKEIAPRLITSNNIDEAIDAALSKSTSNNFAVDLRGNKYVTESRDFLYTEPS